MEVDVIIIQATREDGFNLQRVLRVKNSADELFSITKKSSDFSEQYNPLILNAREVFTTLYQSLTTRYPRYSFKFYYASKGETKTVDTKIKGAAGDLCQKLKSRAPNFSCDFEFIGAAELFVLATKAPRLDFTLKCSGVVSSNRSGNCVVAFMSLGDYLEFIKDENGKLRTTLFDSNVRDFQGEVAVNKAIEETLREPSSLDFWWLNNGITIVADEVSATQKEITVSDPQIVNGLQTSQKIFDYFSTPAHRSAAKSDTRELVIRVIEALDTESYDAIIRATNSQTKIPQAYLWATQHIHWLIESHFRTKDLFYDRRRNSWRREGKPQERVIGITELAQSLVAVFRQEPHDSRGSPGRYFKNASQHKKIFSDTFDIDMYVFCARLKKRVTAFLKTTNLDRWHRNNVLFYVMLVSVCFVCESARKPRSQTLAKQKIERFTDAVLKEAFKFVSRVYIKLGQTDKVAKSSDMTQLVLDRLRKRYPPDEK